MRISIEGEDRSAQRDETPRRPCGGALVTAYIPRRRVSRSIGAANAFSSGIYYG